MSLLIPGLNLPNDKPVTLFIMSNRNVYLDGVLLSRKAVPISPHGDLIDRDEAVRDLRMDYAYAAARIVSLQPTIIPAEEESDGRIKEEE